MRRLLAIAVLTLIAQSGCKHTAGVCDCGQSPGQSFPVTTSHSPANTPVYTAPAIAPSYAQPMPAAPLPVEPIPAPKGL